MQKKQNITIKQFVNFQWKRQELYSQCDPVHCFIIWKENTGK